MKNFPQLRYNIQSHSTQISTLRGVNMSDRATDGDIAECSGLSARRFPSIATSADRQEYRATGSGDEQDPLSYADACDNAEAMTVCKADNGLAYVKDDHLYYWQPGDAAPTDCGAITGGAKQFAAVNTKLVIWPDKLYLDLNTMTLKSLGAKEKGTAAEFTNNNTLTVSWPDEDFRDVFAVGDVVTISGCAQTANNISAQIVSVAQKVLTFQDNVFTNAQETGEITIAREIPPLDYIVESNNRLWGCSSETKSIYASALGDPTNFNLFNGLSTASWALPTEAISGSFTGCAKLGSAVLFWKDHQLLKILGNTPADYSLYSYEVEGVKEGCHRSQVVINDTLYYVAQSGVYAYGGGIPQRISDVFGSYRFGDSVAGTDGKRYYLCTKQGDNYDLWVLDLDFGMWLREGATQVIDFARMGDTLMMILPHIVPDTNIKRRVYSEHYQDDGTGEWYALFVPFLGGPQTRGNQAVNRQKTMGRKRYTELQLRVELSHGSYLRADVRYDGQRWYRAGELHAGSEDVMRDVRTLRVRLERCDSFELKLSGKGSFAISSIVLKYKVGSDR